MSWSTIETAPKNGTEVLAWREDAGVFIARYGSAVEFFHECEIEQMLAEGADNDLLENDCWWLADFIAGQALEGYKAPTHWMPKPQGPNYGEGDK